MIYSPPYFQIQDDTRIIHFINENPFATVITCKESSISNLSKIPLMLKKENGLYLEGHLARVNPHWKSLKENVNVNIIFDGPHDYISPTWYKETHKSVPTWNYSTIVVKGKAEVIDSSDWLLRSIMEFSDKFEKDSSWKDSVDRDYLKNLSKEIVRVNIKVEKFYAKFKLSQQQGDEDRNNVIKELSITNKKLSSLMKSI